MVRVHTARGTHFEDLGRIPTGPLASDRKFGLVLGLIGVTFSVWPMLHGKNIRVWLLFAALALIVVALLRPTALHRANVSWAQIGVLLGKIVAPLTISAMYALLVIPLAWFLRLSGKDILRLRIDKSAATYWLPRQPGGNSTEQMLRQF